MLLGFTVGAVILLASIWWRPNAGQCREPESHSGNVEARLSPTATHPLIGFWRSRCRDAFGLAIDQAGPGLYSISFCGPGGCFEPGTYRPDSPIVGDPAYRVVDPDTIDVLGLDGFSTWHRCENAPPALPATPSGGDEVAV